MRKSASKPNGTKSKYVLAVRMLVAKTDWLEGQLRWQAGHVAWVGEHGCLVPSAADLACAQHALNKIVDYPLASRAALGDADAWLSRRRARLELAKQLRSLSTPQEVRRVRADAPQSPQATERQTELLMAEALCLNALPDPPSARLFALAERAVDPLRQFLQTGADVPMARALAALVLGAIAHVTESTAPPDPVPHDAWLRRCYAWGLRHGLPTAAALTVALLADEQGEALVLRCQQAMQSPSAFRLPIEFLRQLLAEGVPAAQVVAMAEAAAAAHPLAEKLLDYRRALPETVPSHDRRRAAEALRLERQQALADLVSLVQGFAESTRDPEVHRLATTVGLRLLSLADGTAIQAAAIPVLHQTVVDTLKAGLGLEPAWQATYLALLVECHDALWGVGEVSERPHSTRAHRELNHFRNWLNRCWCQNVRPVAGLLQTCRSGEVVARALKAGVAASLARQKWRDPALTQYAVWLAEWLGLPEIRPNDYFFQYVCQMLDAFSTAREARAYLQPLVQALQSSSDWRRRQFLEALCDEIGNIGNTRQAMRTRLGRLGAYGSALVRFAETDSDWAAYLRMAAIRVALALDRAQPETARARLGWVLGFLSAWAQPSPRTYEQLQSLQIGLALAVALAGDREVPFQAILRTAVAHHFRQEQQTIERGTGLLTRLPALRAALAHLFPQQPQRCVDLLVRLGLTTRLGTDVSTRLASLEPQALTEKTSGGHFPVLLCPHAGWWEVHRLATELTAQATDYLHAQWLLQGSLDLPPGVRRALDRPRRARAERAHLTVMQTQQPDRSDLAARARKLDALLSDPERLAHTVRAEVQERLTQVAAQAQLAAAEQQVLACYRARLEAVAGPLPAHLAFGADLINATLLTVDIQQNRKLLLHLLRAYLAGKHDWREQHPANRRFLAGLSEQGVDAAAWLAEHPRRIACAGVPGRWVHLRLERDPLHVLQMGNYFDTCLSFGGGNAFSTVANACELNKRVVYARDGFGRVIGRKLIGISAEGKLVGFHTYVSLTDEADNAALRKIIRAYIVRFAERCGVPLADTGTVPALFAEEWYDDGVVAWSAEEPPSSASCGRSDQQE